MRSAFRYAYIQAKLHGRMAESWLRRSIQPLVRGGSISDVAGALFPGAAFDLPERALIRRLQEAFDSSTVRDMSRTLRTLDPCPPILVHLFREREYRLVKTLVRGKGSDVEILGDAGLRGAPFFQIRTESPTLDLDALTDTEFEWVIKSIETDRPHVIEGRLDRQYYETLIELAGKVRGAERPPVLEMVRSEATLQNLVWILRLRRYFGMRSENIVPLLVPVSRPFPDRPTATLLEAGLDSPDELRGWKYSWLVAGTSDVDPAEAERRARAHLFHLAKRCFYSYPFRLALIYSFFKLKAYEAERISTILEGLAMALPEDELIASATLE